MQKAVLVGAILAAALGLWWFTSGGEPPIEIRNPTGTTSSEAARPAGSPSPVDGQASRAATGDGSQGSDDFASGAANGSGPADQGGPFLGTSSRRSDDGGAQIPPQAGTRPTPGGAPGSAPGPGGQERGISTRGGQRTASTEGAEGSPVTAPPTNQELTEAAFGDRRTRPTNPDPRDNIMDAETADYYARRSLGENPSEAELNERRGWFQTLASGESETTRKGLRDRAMRDNEDGAGVGDGESPGP